MSGGLSPTSIQCRMPGSFNGSERCLDGSKSVGKRRLHSVNSGTCSLSSTCSNGKIVESFIGVNVGDPAMA